MTHSGFDLLNTTTFPRGGGVGTHLRHCASNAEVVAIRNADPEMLFGIMFETLPRRADGVAHVLEHLVFRGSNQYPQSQLYAKLLQGSLLTGLNASTRADSTLFHLSSADEDDLANLIDIVLDAVFHPRIRDADFHEERHVVINEMAGHHAAPANVVQERLRQVLLPGSVYAVDFGGAPDMIAELTQADLRNFHAQHYRSSKARLFLWGDFDLTARLDQLDALLGTDQATPANNLGMPAQFDAPQVIRADYAAAGQTPTMTGFGWAFDAKDADLWRAISLALLSDPDGPLRQRITAWGGRVIGAGFTNDTPMATFEFAWIGHADTTGRALSDVIDTTLQTIQGAPSEDWMRRAVGRLELQLRSQQGQMPGPPGLGALNMIRGPWRHAADPLELLDIDARMTRLRETITGDPQAMTRLISADLLHNPHRVVLSMHPQPASNSRLSRPQIRQAPDPTRVETNTPLPFVSTARPHGEVPTIPVETQGRVLRLQGRNADVARAELAISLGGLTGSQVDLVPLLDMLLGDQSADDGTEVWTRCWVGAPGHGILSIAGHALHMHVAPLLRHLFGTLDVPLPPADTVRQRISAGQDRLRAQLANMGHLFCETRLRARASSAGALSERLTGLYLQDTLTRSLALAPDALLAQLETVRRNLRDTATWTLAVSGVPDAELTPFTAHKAKDTRGPPGLFKLDFTQAETIATGAANFTTGQAVHLGDPGPAHMAAHMLETGWLWDAVRVAGGAYSVRSAYQTEDGLLSMVSIRDPSPNRTLSQFAKTPVWLRAAANSELLHRCVAAKAGHLCRPVRPESLVSIALQRHLNGSTDAARQSELERVLHVDAPAMIRCADAIAAAQHEAATVVMGPGSGLAIAKDD